MHTKTLLRSTVSFSAVSFFLCALASPLPVQAGFQWVPPEQAAQMSAAPLMAPQAPADAAPVLAPQIIEGPSVATGAATVTVPAPVLAPSAPASLPSSLGTITTPVLTPPPAAIAPSRDLADSPLIMDSAPVPALPVKEGTDKVVLGFANNVPLSVALRQVLPPDFAYSVAQDVSLGTLVSWRGGSDWRQVLKDMLLPAGLASKEEGLMVEIVPAMAPLGALPEMKAPAMEAGKPFMGETLEAPSSVANKPVSLIAPPTAMEPSPLRGAAPPSMGYLKAPAESPAPLRSVAPPVSLTDPMPEISQVDTVDVWTVQRGETLRDALEKWGARAKVDVSWQSEYDYPLQASVSFSGSFEEAVRGILSGLQDAKPQPIGKLHKNAEAGQTVLIIQARGNNYND